jgi:predicted secreted protein
MPPLRRALPLALAAALTAGGCAFGPDPQTIAERAIANIDAGDAGAVRDAVAANVRPSVTDDSVRQLARLMHGFGAYNGLVPVATLPDRRYDFEAQFDGGSMLVQLRLDSGGRIAALHIVPNVPETFPRARP